MLPVIIIALIVIPLLAIAYFARRRSVGSGEHPAAETQVDQYEIEQEFEESERYQEQWRKEHPDTSDLP